MNKNEWYRLPDRNVLAALFVIVMLMTPQPSAADQGGLTAVYGDSAFYALYADLSDSVRVIADTTTLFFINMHRGFTIREHDAYLDTLKWTKTMQPYIDMCYLVKIDTVRYFMMGSSDSLMFYNQFWESISRPDNIIYECEGVIRYE